MKRTVIMAGIITILTAGSHGIDRYVSLSGTNDADGKYTNWVGAATQIQWAVDVATNGETVLVSNGTYYLTNQISITNSITLRSFSRSYTNTLINGNYFAYTNIRGVYIANTGAVLDGFTITNCYTTNQYGAGFAASPCKLITNCLMTGNTASTNLHGGGGYVNSGLVSKCSFIGNRAVSSSYAGGLYMSRGIISNCVFSRNSGGYALWMAYGNGSCTAVNCVVSGNIGTGVRTDEANWLYSCIISSNSSQGIEFGSGGRIRNCLIICNGSYGVSASIYGSGYHHTIDDCTIANNAGIGIYINWNISPSLSAWVANSIIYNNGAGGNQNWSFNGTNYAYTNCCTIPIPANALGRPQGTGNITNAPLFANTNIGNYRLSANSPCVNTGTNRIWMTGTFDFDGKQRIRYGTLDMGAYERIYEGTIYKYH